MPRHITAEPCTYAGKGDFDQAIADYTGAIRLGATYAEAHLRGGATPLRRVSSIRPLLTTAAAIRLNPKFADAFAGRG